MAEGVRAVHVDDGAVRFEQRDRASASEVRARGRSGVRRDQCRLDRVLELPGLDPLECRRSAARWIGRTGGRVGHRSSPTSPIEDASIASTLSEPAPVARLPREGRGEERNRALGRGLDPDHPRPERSTFMSSCSTPWCARYVSWQTPARMPRILLTAMDAPTPDPQMRIPRSACPSWIAWPSSHAKSG